MCAHGRSRAILHPGYDVGRRHVAVVVRSRTSFSIGAAEAMREATMGRLGSSPRRTPRAPPPPARASASRSPMSTPLTLHHDVVTAVLVGELEHLDPCSLGMQEMLSPCSTNMCGLNRRVPQSREDSACTTNARSNPSGLRRGPEDLRHPPLPGVSRRFYSGSVQRGKIGDDMQLVPGNRYLKIRTGSHLRRPTGRGRHPGPRLDALVGGQGWPRRGHCHVGLVTLSGLDDQRWSLRRQDH